MKKTTFLIMIRVAHIVGPSHLKYYHGDKNYPCLLGIELRQTYQIQITLDKKLSGDVSSFAKWASSGVIFSPSCYAVYNWTASRQAALSRPDPSKCKQTSKLICMSLIWFLFVETIIFDNSKPQNQMCD